jgi:hypothetical protein
MFTLEKARTRRAIAAGRARLAAMRAEDPDIAALVDSMFSTGITG